MNYGQEDEDRMNIIGQNGNDGEHYTQEKPTPPRDLSREQTAIEKILKRKLTQWEVRDLQENKDIQIFNDPKNNDDNIIKY